MNKYFFIGILSESLIGVEHIDYGNQLLTLGKIRKVCNCIICRTSIIGKEAWHPITNCGNRSDRICTLCMEKIKQEI